MRAARHDRARSRAWASLYYFYFDTQTERFCPPLIYYILLYVHCSPNKFYEVFQVCLLITPVIYGPSHQNYVCSIEVLTPVAA